MVKKPLTLDHYTFINQLLDLKDNARLEPNKEIINKEKIINQLIEQQKISDAIQNDEAAKQNSLKLHRVIETLNDVKKRKHYDEALTNKPKVKLKIDDKEVEGLIIPLVPIEDILSEYEAFKNEMMQLKDEDGKPLFKEGDFKYEKHDGPPVFHVLHFPDEATANAYLERLFSKNMAMFPDGSQSTEDKKVSQEPKKSADSFKDALKEVKASAPVGDKNPEIEPDQERPNPLKTRPN